MGLEFGQIVTQILAFLVMLWVMKKYGWKPMLDMLEQRKHKIQSAFEEINAQKTEVQKKLDLYELKLNEIETEARKRIQESINHGKKIASAVEEEAQNKAKEILESTKHEVAREIANAQSRLKKDLANLVVITTEKLLRQKITDEEQRKLIVGLVEEVNIP